MFRQGGNEEAFSFFVADPDGKADWFSQFPMFLALLHADCAMEPDPSGWINICATYRLMAVGTRQCSGAILLVFLFLSFSQVESRLDPQLDRMRCWLCGTAPTRRVDGLLQAKTCLGSVSSHHDLED